MSRSMPSTLRRFLRATEAVALIEFALVFPVLFVLLFGGIEVGRNILITLKVEKAGYVLTDIVSQYAPATGQGVQGEISAAVLTNEVFPQYATIMGAYGGAEKQRIIFSAVRNDAGQLRLKWQNAGGGTYAAEDVKSIVNGKKPEEMNPDADTNSVVHFTSDPETQSFLAGVAPGETFLVGEVFFHYEPILRFILLGVTSAFQDDHLFFLNERTIVKRMYFRPRGGDLICLPPTFLHDECRIGNNHAGAGCSCVYASSQRVTDCHSRAVTIRDFYRCGDGTTRERNPLTSDAPFLAGCGRFGYGKAIEEVSRSFLNGSCINP